MNVYRPSHARSGTPDSRTAGFVTASQRGEFHCTSWTRGTWRAGTAPCVILRTPAWRACSAELRMLCLVRCQLSGRHFCVVRQRFVSFKVWLASCCASPPPPPPSLHPPAPTTFPASAVSCDADAVLAWRKYPCEACGRELNGDQEWAIHIKSRKHWKNVARVERQVALAAVGGDPRLLPHTKRARSPKARGEAGAGAAGAPVVPKGE